MCIYVYIHTDTHMGEGLADRNSGSQICMIIRLIMRICSSKIRTRRVAEIFRVKDCHTIGSKNKVCL